MYAAAYGLNTMADMLLYYDADVNLRSSADSSTALQIAVITGNQEIAEMLVQRGADVNAQDVLGFTPLMIAAQANDTAMIRFLMSKGADLSTKTIAGYDALSIAVEKGNDESVRVLLDKGVLPGPVSGTTLTPLKISRIKENYKVERTLRNHGVPFEWIPVFNKLTFSFESSFSPDDVFLGGDAGISDAAFKTAWYLGFCTRAKALPLLILRQEPDQFYQFLENRSFFYLCFEKRFNIFIRNRYAEGIAVGLKELYTFGHYHGTGMKPDRKFVTSPQAGIYYMVKNFGVKLNYQYLDFGINKASPHRIELNLWFAINILKTAFQDREMAWL